MIKAYFKYRRKAVGPHKIHSPFVFEFYNEVIRKVKEVDDRAIHKLRKQLLKDNREIEITDLGVGSRTNAGNIRKISQMAKTSAVNRKYGKLLKRIAEHYQLKSCLELGTSLGLGSCYLGQGAEYVITVEGCPNIQYEAVMNSEKLGLTNTEFINAEFSEVLDDLLVKVENLDLLYVDGNHGYEPTMRYFNKAMEHLHDNAFIIFDDINWSDEMRKAWDEICADNRIHVSMELFRMGIVLKRPHQAKEHFVLKF